MQHMCVMTDDSEDIERWGALSSAPADDEPPSSRFAGPIVVTGTSYTHQMQGEQRQLVINHRPEQVMVSMPAASSALLLLLLILPTMSPLRRALASRYGHQPYVLCAMQKAAKLLRLAVGR